MGAWRVGGLGLQTGICNSQKIMIWTHSVLQGTSRCSEGERFSFSTL